MTTSTDIQRVVEDAKKLAATPVVPLTPAEVVKIVAWAVEGLGWRAYAELYPGLGEEIFVKQKQGDELARRILSGEVAIVGRLP